MVLALAGDSTTTTSAIVSLTEQPMLLGRRRSTTRLPGSVSHAAGELQFQQRRHDGGGRELAAAHQIVNRRGRRAEQVGDLGARLS